MKKGFCVFLALIFAALALFSCGKSDVTTDTAETRTNDTKATETAESAEQSASGEDSTDAPDDISGDVTSEEDDSGMFSDGDRKDVTDGSKNATIILAGSEGTISDSTRGSSGSEVTITSKGVYHVVGTSNDVTLKISDEKESGNIYVILDSLTMTNTSLPCIYIEKADKVILQCAGSSFLTFSASEAELDGAIYAKDDLTINGTGSLAVTSALHGIVAKNDLKIVGVSLDVEADSVGIKAGDSVRVSDAGLLVKSGHDGVRIENTEGSSFLYFESGSATISAGYDGVHVGGGAGYVTIDKGSFTVTAGGGSDNSKDADTSTKGIKCDGNISIGDAGVIISSADDALHAGYNVNINGGTLSLSSSDDGVHADNALNISGGVVNVTKSYEGFEAYEVNISDGEINVVSSDDGVNAGGGSDSSSDETLPSAWSDQPNGTITVSGGKIYVNAQGDGLDSNGSIFVTGGYVIVEGPSGRGNGAIDKGDSPDCVASITGGTVLAIGSADMAINFTTGTQCSALVSVSGTAGDTIAVNDGSGFTFTATKSFECVLYSSPDLKKSGKYKITAGSSSAEADFSASIYYSDVDAKDAQDGK